MTSRVPPVGFFAAALVVACGVWLATASDPRRKRGDAPSEEHALARERPPEARPLVSRPPVDDERAPEPVPTSPDASAPQPAPVEGLLRRASGDGAALCGRVVDDEGNAVAGAEVVAWCRAGFTPERAPDRATLTDGRGDFRIASVGPEFTLVARKPGFACGRGLRGTLAKDTQPADELVVTLLPVAAIRGLVVDEAGRPVEGARIQVHADGSSSTEDATAVTGVRAFTAVHLDATSAADGRFELAPLPRGRWGVTVEKAGFRRFHAAFVDGADARIVIARGLVLRGRVLAHDGMPAVGAHVRGGTVGEVDQRARTDAQGRFELPALAANEAAYVVVHARGNALFRRNAIAVGDVDPAPLEIRLEAPAHLAGVVVDAQRAPIAGAHVHIEGRAIVGSGFVHARPSTIEFVLGLDAATTDALGRFRFDDLYDGEFEISASRAEAPGLTQRLNVRTSADDLELVLDEAALQRVVLAGRIVDALTGAPIARARLTPMRERSNGTTSGNSRAIDSSDGSFRVAGLQAGAYLLQVHADGYASWSSGRLELAEGEHAFDVRLFPSRAIEVSIRWRGARPADQTVWASFTDPEGSTLAVDAGSSSWSAISLRETPTYVAGLPAKRVRVSVRGAPGVAAEPIEVDLAREPIAPLVLELDYAKPPEERTRRHHLIAAWVFDPADAGATLSDLGRLARDGKAGFFTDELEVAFLDGEGNERARASLTAVKDGKRTAAFRGHGTRSSAEVDASSALSCELEARIRSLRATAPGYVERALPIVPTDEEDPLLLVVLVRR